MIAWIIIILVGAMLLGLLLAIPFGFLVVGAQAAAKRKAHKLLEMESPDPKAVKKVLSALGKDAESIELVRRLMDASRT